MALLKWKPQYEMERFFNEPLVPNLLSLARPLTFDFAVDVCKDKDNVIAMVSLPGVKEKDIDISIDDNMLTISAERQEVTEDEDTDYYYKEINRGTFSRTVTLPASVKAAAAEADLEDGLLTITMPIHENAKDRKVKVRIK